MMDEGIPGPRLPTSGKGELCCYNYGAVNAPHKRPLNTAPDAPFMATYFQSLFFEDVGALTS